MIHYFFTDNVKIYKNATAVIVEAPTHGLKNVTFDGVILKVFGLLLRLLLPFGSVLWQCNRPTLQFLCKDVVFYRLPLLHG